MRQMTSEKGRTTKRGDRIRITIDLTKQQYARLSALEEQIEAETKAQVVRQALKLYEYVITRYLAGDTVCARSKDGHEENLVFINAVSSPQQEQ